MLKQIQTNYRQNKHQVKAIAVTKINLTFDKRKREPVSEPFPHPTSQMIRSEPWFQFVHNIASHGASREKLSFNTGRLQHHG